MIASTHTLMVTAVGALVGQGIVRSLRLGPEPHRIIGLDLRVNIYGASLVDHCYQKPCKEDSASYLPWLREVIARERIELILPGIEEDVFFFHDHRAAMQDWPVKVVLNSAQATQAGRDKWLLHEKLTAHGLPSIPTMLMAEWRDFEAQLGAPPYLVKARRGSGSRGQMIFRSEEDWQRHRHQFGDAHMVQRVVGSDDDEYTVGMFGLGDGTATAFLVLQRKLWSGGTWTAEVVDGDAALKELCASLNRMLQPLGPTNYQFRREGGTWYLLEINPRLSASASIRAGFGFNEALMCVDYHLRQRTPVAGPLRRGRCQRYIADHFDFA